MIALRTTRAAWIAVALALAACGDDDGGGAAAASDRDASALEFDGGMADAAEPARGDLDVEMTVGPEGGELSAEGVEVTIPEGALDEEVQIRIRVEPEPVELPEAWEASGEVYEITPHGLSFAVPITIELPYDGVDDESLNLVKLDDADDESWAETEAESFAGGKVRFSTSSLSFYTVVRICPLNLDSLEPGAVITGCEGRECGPHPVFAVCGSCGSCGMGESCGADGMCLASMSSTDASVDAAANARDAAVDAGMEAAMDAHEANDADGGACESGTLGCACPCEAELECVQATCRSPRGIDSLVPAGLIAYYPLNGSADDASGSGNGATVVGASPAVDRFGQAGGALAFDGIDDHVARALPAAMRADRLSVSLWMRSTDVSSLGSLWGMIPRGTNCDSRGMGSYAQDDRVNVWVGTQQNGTFDNFWPTEEFSQLEVWNHVVIALDSPEVSIYVNGELLDQITIPGDIEWADAATGGPSVAQLVFGAYVQCYSDGRIAPDASFYAGALDDIRIYDRPLSLEEVAVLYAEHGWTGN